MSYLVSDVFPAGIVLPYAGSTAPAGWLMCDGESYLRASYPRLFDAIQTVHGTNAPNTFNVPDYRGQFLRGADNMGTPAGAAGKDPNSTTRTAAKVGGNVGNAVGSVQADGTAKNSLAVNSVTVTGAKNQFNHTHTFNPGGISNDQDNSGNFVSGLRNSGDGDTISGYSISTKDFATDTSPNFTASGTPTLTVGDSETRPLNVYVNYIIKV